MGLTSIGQQKTPGRPIEITFDAETGLPSDAKEVLLFGHQSATGGSASGDSYTVINIDNAGSISGAKAEAEAKFGAGSELAKMVIAAVTAVASGGTFPVIKCVPLASTDTDFGAADAALTAAARVKAEYLVSPYDGQTSGLRTSLRDTAALMSGPQRVENNQFGTYGVIFNRAQTSPSSLDAPDSQYLIGVYLRDTGTGDNEPAYSIGEMAAAAAAMMAANGVPFNPQDDVVIPGVAAPAKLTDYITVGEGLESEAALAKGWTPLYVKPNGDVAFVRTVTTRITTDGIVAANAYYDAQDFDVLYFWRKTLKTRFSQPDFKRRKASEQTALDAKSEMIRLAKLFEAQGMFQAVDKLAPQFKVERNVSDRHRFDYLTPVNVVPGLHVLAGNIKAGTQFDVITV